MKKIFPQTGILWYDERRNRKEAFARMELLFDLLRSVVYGVIEGITEWLKEIQLLK